MIIVAGVLTLPPAVIADFDAAVRDMLARVRAEDGCMHYSLLAEHGGTGQVNVLEIWRDDAALIAHFKQPWIIEFFGRFGPQLLGSTVQVYDVAGAPRPLPPM